MDIMIIPYVASLSEDAMRAVPMALREGSACDRCDALADRFAGGRSVGHFGDRLGLYPGNLARRRRDDDSGGGRRDAAQSDFQSGAAWRDDHLVHRPGVMLGDLPHGSIGYQTIFAAGLMLMSLTLVFNLIGFYMRKKYREAY